MLEEEALEDEAAARREHEAAAAARGGLGADAAGERRRRERAREHGLVGLHRGRPVVVRVEAREAEVEVAVAPGGGHELEARRGAGVAAPRRRLELAGHAVALARLLERERLRPLELRPGQHPAAREAVDDLGPVGRLAALGRLPRHLARLDVLEVERARRVVVEHVPRRALLRAHERRQAPRDDAAPAAPDEGAGRRARGLAARVLPERARAARARLEPRRGAPGAQRELEDAVVDEPARARGGARRLAAARGGRGRVRLGERLAPERQDRRAGRARRRRVVEGLLDGAGRAVRRVEALRELRRAALGDEVADAPRARGERRERRALVGGDGRRRHVDEPRRDRVLRRRGLAREVGEEPVDHAARDGKRLAASAAAMAAQRFFWLRYAASSGAP